MFASLISVLVLFGLYIYLKSNSGAMPDLGLMSKYQSVFWKMGYFMMPIPWPNSVALYSIFVAVLALVVALRGNVEVDDLSKNSLIFISLLFSGLFIYYQGRSHILNFALISWMFYILSMKLFDYLLIKKNYHTLATLVPSIIFVSLSGVMYLGKYQSVVDYLSGKAGISYSDDSFVYLREKVEFIRSKTINHESCLILTPHQGLFHLESPVRSSFNGPSLIELILSSDMIKYKNAARDSECLIFGVGKFDPNLSFKWGDVSMYYSIINFNHDSTLVYMAK
jgi:hypothetical protein